MTRRDPLANPDRLIRRVYSYAAYRLGNGADAEDATSEVFERALRYRDSYDESRGLPEQWLIGIARRCVDDALVARRVDHVPSSDAASQDDLEEDVVRRLDVAAAIERLDDRARDLLALRFGADLTARQIGDLLDMKTNAVEVALHRTLSRMRQDLEEPVTDPKARGGEPSAEPAG
jgi:RNA polymerase sigma factor (sigma-70 family)